MGHPFSAVRGPIVAALGQIKGHAKQTWCTILELNWPFLQRVGAEVSRTIYSGTVTMYFGTLARTSRDESLTPVYLLGYRVHSSPGHSMSFKGNLFVATKHGR